MMARSPRPQPKPLSALRGEFHASLENVAHHSLLLIQAIEITIRANQVTEEGAKVLREQVDAFKVAWFGVDEPGE